MATPSRVRPHRWVTDPDVPVDQHGRQYCRRCGCPGAAGDARHPNTPMPTLDPHTRTVTARILGERE